MAVKITGTPTGKQTVTVKLRGFESFAQKVSRSKFRKRLQRNIRQATMRNALDAEKAIRGVIRSGVLAPNRPRTRLIKGSSRPLVDDGDLLASITHKIRRFGFEAIVGVLRKRIDKGEGGAPRDIRNLAFILHEGAVMTVTPKMRRFFAWKSRMEPEVWFPLAASTTVLAIKGRPFFKIAIRQNRPLRERIKSRWRKAVGRALRGLNR